MHKSQGIFQLLCAFAPTADLFGQRYNEGSQHILDALSLQDAEGVHDAGGVNDARGGITSSALWESLKTACLHMQRIDLATLCDKRDLEGMFRLL